jgi:hypothetical protein
VVVNDLFWIWKLKVFEKLAKKTNRCPIKLFQNQIDWFVQKLVNRGIHLEYLWQTADMQQKCLVIMEKNITNHLSDGGDQQ